MTITITSRSGEGLVSASRYTTTKYEGVPRKIGDEIVREFPNYEGGNGGQAIRKEYRSPGGCTETIDIDYCRVVCIVASP